MMIKECFMNFTSLFRNPINEASRAGSVFAGVSFAVRMIVFVAGKNVVSSSQKKTGQSRYRNEKGESFGFHIDWK